MYIYIDINIYIYIYIERERDRHEYVDRRQRAGQAGGAPDGSSVLVAVAGPVVPARTATVIISRE